jgi:hypothetical protein
MPLLTLCEPQCLCGPDFQVANNCLFPMASKAQSLRLLEVPRDHICPWLRQIEVLQVWDNSVVGRHATISGSCPTTLFPTSILKLCFLVQVVPILSCHCHGNQRYQLCFSRQEPFIWHLSSESLSTWLASRVRPASTRMSTIGLSKEHVYEKWYKCVFMWFSTTAVPLVL